LGHLRLNAPTEFLPCIAERFDLVSLANNHILDQDDYGLYRTMLNMDKHNIAFVGVGDNLEEAWEYEVVGNFAIMGVSYTCYNDKNNQDCDVVARMTDDSKYMRNTIKQIKKNHPELIVTIMLHAGKEYDPWSNKLQRDYCHNAV
jgi:poly-gamma-glutamate synthesis protein (capsule biosynthesis protein)